MVTTTCSLDGGLCSFLATSTALGLEVEPSAAACPPSLLSRVGPRGCEQSGRDGSQSQGAQNYQSTLPSTSAHVPSFWGHALLAQAGHKAAHPRLSSDGGDGAGAAAEYPWRHLSRSSWSGVASGILSWPCLPDRGTVSCPQAGPVHRPGRHLPLRRHPGSPPQPCSKEAMRETSGGIVKS